LCRIAVSDTGSGMIAAPQIQDVLDRVVVALRSALGDNLHSCILYGSAVRGNLVPGVSDLNLLLILRESTPAAHAAIAEAIDVGVVVEPFVLGLAGLDRSIRAFASKFLSIRRNYRVLHGADPLAGLAIDPKIERFLCEQGLRNLRLRFVHARIVSRKDRAIYEAFLKRNDAVLFVQLSELLRLNGVEVPTAFEDRVGLFATTFGADPVVLREVLELKRQPRRLSAEDIQRLHSGIFSLLNSAVLWLEAKWTD
jgi:predicted nucleotidyltransferase